MRTNIFFILFILIHSNLRAHKISAKTDSVSGDSLRNSYKMLMHDDPDYNKKSTWIKPAAEVIGINVLTWSIDRYVFNQSYSKISLETWKYNLKNGWKWDNDQLRVNFLGHPYSGTLYFNAARSSGYSYFQSIPFAIEGSLMWEYFGETSRPSYNDIINTPISGAFLGEILYRLSSNILKDDTRGGERIMRELIATILNPVRGFNRLTNGKMFRVTDKEVYQKEPLNITLMGGVHMINNGTAFGSGNAYPMINIQLDYGDPFEIRRRKPLDVFRLRVDFTSGTRIKVPYLITGYGLLSGTNFRKGSSVILAGGFQHYDYWNTKNFQLASLGLGVGIINKISLSKSSDFYSSLQVAAVPLAGTNPLQGADISNKRNYNYGGGFEGKFESTINFGNWVNLSLNGYYYWIRNYTGLSGNNQIGIIKPKIAFWLSRNISIGMEEFIYLTTARTRKSTIVNQSTTEQKFFVQLFLENPKRYGGRYQ